MKFNILLHIPMSLTLLLMLCIFPLYAQNANETLPLSGSTLKTEDVVLRADAGFVGEIERLGFPDTITPGRVTYSGVKVKVIQVIRGPINPEVKVTLYAASTPDTYEHPPKVGGKYIFFIQHTPDWNIVLKLLPDTDANVAKVNALIAAAPPSK